MPDDSGNRAQHLDVTGLLLLSPSIAVLLYGLSQVGATGGFGSPSVLIPLAAGAVLLAAFVLYALSAAQPLLDLRLFRVPSFTVSTLLTFLAGFVLYGALLLMPLYFQDVQSHDPLRTGLLLAPQGIGILASRNMAGALTDRIGPRWVVVAGLVLVAVGTVPFALAGAATSDWGLMAALIVRGAGLGAVTLPVFATAFQGLDRGQIPDASIIIRTAQQVGGSFGSAVLALILASALAQQSAAGPAAAGPGAAGPGAAFRGTFWWATGFSVVAVLLALRLPAGKPAERTG
jgi:MFS family permease